MPPCSAMARSRLMTRHTVIHGSEPEHEVELRPAGDGEHGEQPTWAPRMRGRPAGPLRLQRRQQRLEVLPARDAEGVAPELAAEADARVIG